MILTALCGIGQSSAMEAPSNAPILAQVLAGAAWAVVGGAAGFHLGYWGRDECADESRGDTDSKANLYRIGAYALGTSLAAAACNHTLPDRIGYPTCGRCLLMTVGGMLWAIPLDTVTYSAGSHLSRVYGGCLIGGAGLLLGAGAGLGLLDLYWRKTH
ncbi:MAG: hypothetical protein LBJ92_00980 [Holosporales bacterium]|jgi:hypothetical protein|nr:hypothetical protein [Holosporales bacterium]